MFQSYALFPHMTAAENVAFGLEMQGVPRAERDEARQRRRWRWSGSPPSRTAFRAACRAASSSAWRWPARWSSGRSILLLDEPLSNLDAKLREEMQIELRQIQRTVGTTTILVTHDQVEAMALSDRIVVMNQGRVEQIGPPHEAYERPATPFVASFLGKTNDSAARSTDGRRRDGRWPETADLPARGPSGRAVALRTGQRCGLGQDRRASSRATTGSIRSTRRRPRDRDPPEHRRGGAGRGRGRAARLAAGGHELQARGLPHDAAPTRSHAAMRDAETRALRLTAPALLLFVGVVLIPLAMTVLLSFHDWGQYKGIEPVFILKNWHEVVDRSLFPRDVLADLPHRAAASRCSPRCSARPRPTS